MGCQIILPVRTQIETFQIELRDVPLLCAGKHDTLTMGEVELDPYEQAFMDALDRLLHGVPTNRGLAIEAKAGRLKITKVTVAKEAGHSRTKLYGYPRVLERVEALGGKPASRAHDVITSLRAENAALKQQKHQATDAAAAMLLRMRELERQAVRDMNRVKREARRPDANRVVGNIVHFPGAGDE